MSDSNICKVQTSESTKDKVELFLFPLRYILLELPLRIPDYQRSYCWDERNVNCLLDDISEYIENVSKPKKNGAEIPPYRLRLGCIILHCQNGKYDIIDGQQRLVTLALLCAELTGDKDSIKLLGEIFESSESNNHIAHNKWLIQRFCQGLRSKEEDLDSFANQLLERIEFSVLILQGTSLDLAFTFFSHQNARGVGLSDYDLLKAHHLRYITEDEPAKNAAGIWNKMILKGHETSGRRDGRPDYEIVLDSYLFNLRNWMRNSLGGDDGTKNRIKHEYEAAPVIDRIPPIPLFAERFYFVDPIRGGSYFFQWVQKYIALYGPFTELPILKNLRETLYQGSDNHYRITLEALLFEYYLKFGESNIAEACLCFLRIVTDHRYHHKRVTMESVLKYVSKEHGLVQLIDQSTSPTFILAKCYNITRSMAYPDENEDIRPIQRKMKEKVEKLTKELGTFIQK